MLSRCETITASFTSSRCSSAASSASSSARYFIRTRSTKLDVTAAVITVRNAIASTIITAPTIRPSGVVGVTSPYPTVVTVWSAHHMPTNMFEKSLGSSRRMRIPPATTVTRVAVTITLIAPRTETGFLRERSTSRSIIFIDLPLLFDGDFPGSKRRTDDQSPPVVRTNRRRCKASASAEDHPLGRIRRLRIRLSPHPQRVEQANTAREQGNEQRHLECEMSCIGVDADDLRLYLGGLSGELLLELSVAHDFRIFFQGSRDLLLLVP